MKIGLVVSRHSDVESVFINTYQVVERGLGV